MDENLFDKRRIYSKSELLETNLKDNPIELFRDWYLEAEQKEQTSEVNAMNLATIEENLRPRIRTVLLKKFTWEGFIFFTNYDSRKGKSIEKNNEVCLHFHWESLERQIIIQAKVEKVSESISDGYFESRPKGSQLGALVSNQSSIIKNRKEIEKRLTELEEEYKNKEVIRPKNWGGYIAKPYEIEFWQGRPNRLHDRIIYTIDQDFNWKVNRLSP